MREKERDMPRPETQQLGSCQPDVRSKKIRQKERKERKRKPLKYWSC